MFKQGVYIVILMALLTGCSSNFVTVSSSDARNLIVSDYFPQVGTENTYVMYGEDPSKQVEYTDRVKKEIDKNGIEQIYIQTMGGFLGPNEVQDIDVYEVEETSIRITYRINVFKNQEENELILTNKPQWDTGDGESVSYLSQTGIEVDVLAGSFENCIEVTNVTKTDSNDFVKFNYYAPGIGLIKTVVVLDGDKEVVLSELKGSNWSKFTDDTSADDESQDDEQESSSSAKSKDNDETEEVELTVQGEIYSNPLYGFSIMLPLEWSNQMVVEEGNWAVGAESTIDLYYKISDDVRQNIFSIIVQDGEQDSSEWEGTPWTYITTHKAKTFLYALPGNPDPGVIESGKMETVQKMVEQVPGIIETFETE